MKMWLVYEKGQHDVVFHGLYRRYTDAWNTFCTEHENLRASGNDYAALEIEEFEFEPHARWSR